MRTDWIALAAQAATSLKHVEKPQFELGSVVATPAAIAHLTKNEMPVASLLCLHVGGVWGGISDEDAEANSQAVADGGRILSSYLVGNKKVWIITDAAHEGANGHRQSTCVLLSEEY
ncbi:MAG: hypothetical protein Q8K29_17470 [Polaromonas sp.]|nr:hypothetical protein [Polaromonas sp.]